MKWLEVAVTTDAEGAEAVAELFSRYGRGGAVLEYPVDCFEADLARAAAPATVLVKTYLPLDGSSELQRARLVEGLWHLSQIYPLPEPAFRELEEQDWANAWKQQYRPLRIGRRLAVVPEWEDYTPEGQEVIVRLEPGMAFGTGLHPTTRLSLEALEGLLDGTTQPPPNVLDVGTGSGVLAIAAAKLGAGSVLALDADRVAVDVAQENVARNGVSAQVDVQWGTLPGSTFREWLGSEAGDDPAMRRLEGGRFDLVVINILAPVIAGMAPALGDRTAVGGRLVASGFVESQEAEVEGALLAAGLRVIDRLVEKDWVCLVALRTGAGAEPAAPAPRE